jgi:hypothetical protein
MPHELLEITLPPSAGGRQLVKVLVGEADSFLCQASEQHKDCFLTFQPPHIISCTKVGSPGDCIIVKGRHFGNQKECQVKIGGKVCPLASVRTMHQQICCVVPDPKGTGSSKKKEVSVCVGGQWSTTSDQGATFEFKCEKSVLVRIREMV